MGIDSFINYLILQSYLYDKPGRVAESAVDVTLKWKVNVLTVVSL